ncbi:hypothetical protein KI387_034929, partial [Taxus chinensis]
GSPVRVSRVPSARMSQYERPLIRPNQPVRVLAAQMSHLLADCLADFRPIHASMSQ